MASHLCQHQLGPRLAGRPRTPVHRNLGAGYNSYVDKFERIQVLKKLALNTEESILIRTEEDWTRHKEFLQKFSRYSVRTFRGPGYGHSDPFFPIIAREKLHASYQKLLSDGLNLIVATPIDPSDAEMAGCLLYEPNGITAEVAHGPGTVRRVTQENKIDLRVKSTDRAVGGISDYRIRIAMEQVGSAVRNIQKLCPALKVDWLVFEFSWYDKGVGLLGEPLIFWEVAGPPDLEPALRELTC